MCNESQYYENTFNNNGVAMTTGTTPSDYLQAVIGNATIPWLTRAATRSAAGGAPFFLYAAPHAPHFPAEPAPWYANAPIPNNAAPRTPAFNNMTSGKNWAIRQNAPFSAWTEAGIDTHFRNRQRCLISVDDYVRDMVAVLERTGTLNNTCVGGVGWRSHMACSTSLSPLTPPSSSYIFASSDHSYHLGQYRLPFEKSTPYDIDVRVPFYVRGPGVPAGGRLPALVSLMDVGATMLELTGAVASGVRTTDGRSLVPLLGGAAPPSWRAGGLLVEHEGEVNQWMDICDYVFNASGCTSTPPPVDPYYLIDGPQNTWSQLRILNSTHDWMYMEGRPVDSPLAPASTNWTELYDLAADPYQGVNLAATAPPSLLASLHAQLWAVATCEVDSCP